MKESSRSIFNQCIHALAVRHENGGSWPKSGIPICFIQYRKAELPHLENDSSWFWVVENHIKIEAVLLLANLKEAQ